MQLIFLHGPISIVGKSNGKAFADFRLVLFVPLKIYRLLHCRNTTNPPAYILPGLEPYLNSSCFQLPTGLNSIRTNFGDFQEAYLVGYFYLDTKCADLGLAIENTGASPEYPVQDGQCVQAPPFRSPLTNGSWGSFSLSTFR